VEDADTEEGLHLGDVHHPHVMDEAGHDRVARLLGGI
jgi:hypothetical protein